MRYRPIPERFFEKVHKTDGCHFWLAARNVKGYGKFQIGRTNFLAHRVAWLIEYGKWPEKTLLHSCDTPQCVRLEHLREGTNTENQLDASAKGMMKDRSKAFCKRGHPRTEENLYTQPSSGNRRCRLCFSILTKRYRSHHR